MPVEEGRQRHQRRRGSRGSLEGGSISVQGPRRMGGPNVATGLAVRRCSRASARAGAVQSGAGVSWRPVLSVCVARGV